MEYYITYKQEIGQQHISLFTFYTFLPELGYFEVLIYTLITILC